jgi:hypothetical protein
MNMLEPALVLPAPGHMTGLYIGPFDGFTVEVSPARLLFNGTAALPMSGVGMAALPLKTSDRTALPMGAFAEAASRAECLYVWPNESGPVP